MSIVADDQFYNFRDTTGFVRCSVYIVHRDCLQEFFCRESVRFYILSVDEQTGSTAVYQSSDVLLLLGFCAFDLYSEI